MPVPRKRSTRTKQERNKDYGERPYARARRAVREKERAEDRRAWRRKWYAANREHVRQYQKDYYRGSPEAAEKWRKYFKEYALKVQETPEPVPEVTPTAPA
jgi:hypothetical protein